MASKRGDGHHCALFSLLLLCGAAQHYGCIALEALHMSAYRNAHRNDSRSALRKDASFIGTAALTVCGAFFQCYGSQHRVHTM